MKPFRQQIRTEAEIRVGRQTVWQIVGDLVEVASCIPGCGPVTTVRTGSLYQGRVERTVGPFQFGVDLDVEMLLRDPDERLVLQVRGADARLKTHIVEEIAIELTVLADDLTRITLEVDIEVNGVIAAVGRNLLLMHIDQTITEFLEALTGRAEALQRSLGVRPGVIPVQGTPG